MNRILNIEINIPQSEIDFFSEHANAAFLRKGEYFQRAGETCSKIGFVKSGLLKSFVASEHGKEKIVEFYFENTFVSSFTSFLLQKATDWNIQAMEDSEMQIISKDFLDLLYSRNAQWMKLGLKIYETQTIKKCSREKSLLVNNASERYEIFRKQYGAIEQRLSLHQIALYLGIQPESLSRIRKDFFLNIHQ